MTKIGLIGLGLMGQALATRLLAAEYSLAGFDVSAAQNDAFQRLGGRVAESAAAVAAEADWLILSLPTSSIAVAVLDEIQPQLTGKIVIDTTTADPEDSAAMGGRLAQHQTTYLDATVVGSSKQLRQGDVIVLVGGDQAGFEQAVPLLRCFARHTFYLGSCGSGARMKLVVNLVLGLNRAALAEGLAFAAGCGIDPSQALEVLQSSLAYSRIMDTKGHKMIARDFSTEAKLSQHHKDVRLILAAAANAGLSLPLSSTHDQILSAAEAMGFGEADNSAIIQAYAKGHIAPGEK